MTYVIGQPCIDVTDMSCVDVCPVDCIYEGDRKLYIHPSECIDCGACESVCPVDAVSTDRGVPADSAAHLADNARFFSEPLTGRSAPIGSPGGASLIGRIGVDTPLVQSSTVAE